MTQPTEDSWWEDVKTGADSDLGVEAGVTEAEEEAGGEGERSVGLYKSCLARVLSIRSVLREVDEHEGVRDESEDGAEQENRMSTPLDSHEAKQPEEKTAHHLPSGHDNGTDGGQGGPVLSISRKSYNAELFRDPCLLPHPTV